MCHNGVHKTVYWTGPWKYEAFHGTLNLHKVQLIVFPLSYNNFSCLYYDAIKLLIVEEMGHHILFWIWKQLAAGRHCFMKVPFSLLFVNTVLSVSLTPSSKDKRLKQLLRWVLSWSTNTQCPRHKHLFDIECFCINRSRMTMCHSFIVVIIENLRGIGNLWPN